MQLHQTWSPGQVRPIGRGRVLVVDDDCEMVVLLARALEQEGFTVTVETRAEQAIATAGGADFDAIVVDKEMPGLNGLDFLSYVRHRFPETPVILLTAFGGFLVATEARRRGASAYLEKPVRVERLVETLRTLVANDETMGPSLPDGSHARVAVQTGPAPSLAGAFTGAADPTHRWAVVLAGGRGERLRPLVRHVCGDERPKQYAALLGSRSLLRQTLDRAALAVPVERTVIVSVRDQCAHLEREIGTGPAPHRLLQPEDRGTGAGVLFPVHWIQARDPDATVIVLPSDHFVDSDRGFMAHALALTAHVEAHPERIALVGAEASDPESEYGWITPGAMLARTGAGPLWAVQEFVEKPAAERARRLLATGGLWNTLVLVAKAATLVDAARQLRRGLWAQLASAGAAGAGADGDHELARVYASLPPSNFSSEILEECVSILAVSRLRGVTWCDWGSPRRVIRTVERAGLAPPWLATLSSGEGGRPGWVHDT